MVDQFFFGWIQYTKWWDLFSDPAYARALVHQVAFFFKGSLRHSIINRCIE